MNIIIAPHIDDELIGCYSILNDIDEVYYFFDITEERKLEAINVGKKFNFDCYFNKSMEDIIFTAEDIVYVTTSMDLHKDHKSINRLAKIAKNKYHFTLKYYSIDMNRKPKFLSKLHKQKKMNMYELYPSQKGLFDSDEKYFLFEDIFNEDYIESIVYSINDNDKYIEVILENTFIITHQNIFKLDEKWSNMDASTIHQIIFSNIITNAPYDVTPTKVTIKVNTNKTVIAEYKI